MGLMLSDSMINAKVGSEVGDFGRSYYFYLGVQVRLTFQDQVFTNFRELDLEHHAFRWVDIKRFRLFWPDADDVHLLAELIGHEQYRDDCAGGGVEAGGLRQGPYWLRNLSPTAYAHIDEAGAKTLLLGWERQCGPLPAALSGRLKCEVRPLVAEATGRYRLKDLGCEVFHDWGGVHTDFHELILIDRAAGTLSLLVTADD
ncbi:hypothetical protein [Streptosporangium sp. NPDC006930]|uniref:hypothetical protein n=1 Tax=Streptosporangium sp. NPDC006930 TaxID=3154783 RepID=UPI003417151C